METFEFIWSIICLYSAFAFFMVLAFPKPKTRKQAALQLLASGLMGWGYFLLIAVPRHYFIENRFSSMTDELLPPNDPKQK